ncbi:MAG TPA: nitroreductase family protein, partial [Synergistales bacterium]|nr:nitroreductase family protein [Synergistales bacterium]
MKGTGRSAMGDGALEVILSRRSIRKYTDRAIEEGSLELLLRAAMSAPSAHDQRPWEFVILDDRETLRAITLFHPYSR